jgi:hypothetical protein
VVLASESASVNETVLVLVSWIGIPPKVWRTMQLAAFRLYGYIPVPRGFILGTGDINVVGPNDICVWAHRN